MKHTNHAHDLPTNEGEELEMINQKLAVLNKRREAIKAEFSRPKMPSILDIMVDCGMLRRV